MTRPRVRNRLSDLMQSEKFRLRHKHDASVAALLSTVVTLGLIVTIRHAFVGSPEVSALLQAVNLISVFAAIAVGILTMSASVIAWNRSHKVIQAKAQEAVAKIEGDLLKQIERDLTTLIED